MRKKSIEQLHLRLIANLEQGPQTPFKLELLEKSRKSLARFKREPELWMCEVAPPPRHLWPAVEREWARRDAEPKPK